MLALYGHPFSSYTWKAQIALHALGLEYDFRVLEADHPEHAAFVQQRGGPQGMFPVLAEVAAQLRRTYDWLETWLTGRDDTSSGTTLVECAAAPALFYADWAERIDGTFPRLAAWRAYLNALPAVSRCIEAARPYRNHFPLGAPDRD